MATLRSLHRCRQLSRMLDVGRWSHHGERQEASPSALS